MKYKIIKKSEYEFLKHMRTSQGNSIDILDAVKAANERLRSMVNN